MKILSIYGKSVIVDDDFEIPWGGYLAVRKGYVQIQKAVRKEDGTRGCKIVALHRFIMNAVEKEIVDHINGNPLDSRRVNLRITDARGNNCNRKSTGCYLDRRTGNWIAQIKYRGTHYYLGVHKTRDSAVAARNKKALELSPMFRKCT